MTPAPDDVGIVERYADLAAEIGRRPARLGRVRLVAVDGPAGSGKTSFAARLATALRRDGLRVETVHTDDLHDGWDDQVRFWPRLEATVLGPMRESRPGEYPIYDWTAGRFASHRPVPVADVLIIEGVTAARADVRPELSLAVFVTAPRDLRIDRCLARDGPGIREPLLAWMAREEDHFAHDATADRADRLVDGAPAVGHDPESEYVRRRGGPVRPTNGHATEVSGAGDG
jgi:uridine kinase